MDWIGLIGLVVALLTAVGTILYNWRRSGVEVRHQQFSELSGTVRELRESLVFVQGELRETRRELKEAEAKIDQLRIENTVLKTRVAQLEAENRQLREGLRDSSAC